MDTLNGVLLSLPVLRKGAVESTIYTDQEVLWRICAKGEMADKLLGLPEGTHVQLKGEFILDSQGFHFNVQKLWDAVS